jgi:hypothetical protein
MDKCVQHFDLENLHYNATKPKNKNKNNGKIILGQNFHNNVN